MEERKYLVSEAEKLTGEKAHVLRYWEEELGMTIGRNEMGHRYYTEQDIRVFLGIRELKKKGLHLKAIRDLLPKLLQATAELHAVPVSQKQDEEAKVVVDLLPENKAESIAEQIMDEAEEEKKKRFYEILNRLLDQMMLQKRQEERCHRVDEAIRKHQQSRREAAATLEQKRKKGRKKNA